MKLEIDIEKKYSEFHSQLKYTINSSRCGIFGPSGSGKSTIMNMLSGLVKPDRGSIRLNDTILFDSEQNINLPPEKRRVGVVFQHAHLFPHMNVSKNLFYGQKRTQPEERNIEPDQLISALHLEHLLDRKVTRLSGGERQRVALGRTILACPHLILLDEPLSGLDSTLKYQIIPYLCRVFDQFSIPMLFISHSLQEMRMMTDNVLVMKKGGMTQVITTENLARTSIGTGGRGYSNLLQLDAPKDRGDLIEYLWDNIPVMLVKNEPPVPGHFRLNSRDILLFKKHPEATSARNMLPCRVKSTYQTNWLTGIELDCQGQALIAEIVPQSVQEMGLEIGSEVVAVFKASAMERLY